MANTYRITLSILLSFILGITSFTYTHISKASTIDEFDVLRERYYDYLTGGSSYDPDLSYLEPKIEVITTNAQEHWETLNTDEQKQTLWDDLQYGSNHRDNDIYTHMAYQRVLKMALAYKTKGSPLYLNNDLKEDIVDSLEWLYIHKYNENSPTISQQSGQGFKREMGIPHDLVKCITIMYDELTPEQVNKYLITIDHFMPNPAIWVGHPSTGANRTFGCFNIILRGILGKNSGKISQATAALEPVFNYVTSGDGMYVDGSFIQHGSFAYTGLYGRGLLRDTVLIEYLLNGSQWQLDDPDAVNIYNWVYDAFEPLIHKGFLFDDARGRSAGSGYPRESTQLEIISAILCLSRINGTHQERLQGMAKYMVDQTPADYFETKFTTIRQNLWAQELLDDESISSRGPLLTYKQFASMDYVVQQRDAYAIGISMHSDRTSNYESINNENKRGWHQGDGWMQILDTDYDSYANVYWPTINSYRLPGTTVEKNTTYSGKKKSRKNWVGGTDIQGIYGVTGMELQPRDKSLSAKKSWFMFDDEVVCLGAGISSSGNKVVETIVENKMIAEAGDNTLTVDGNIKSSQLGWEETLDGVSWAHIEGNTDGGSIGYYFPDTTSIKALREARTGSWYDISPNIGVSKTPHTRNYLSLWLDHGTNPSNESYEYVLLPDKSASQLKNYASNPHIEVIANNSTVQAVKEKHLNVIAANFWTDSTQSAATITANKKASVMTREADNFIEISVSDPTQSNSGKITVEIDKKGYEIFALDKGVTVEQLEPSIRLSVNVKGSKGKTYRARIALVEGAELDYQAEESHIQQNCTIENSRDGYTGSGYVNFSGMGSYVEWGQIAKGNGTKAIELNYINDSSESSEIDVILNQHLVATTELPTTTTWSSIRIENIDFKSGYNQVRIIKNTAEGQLELDKMEINTEDTTLPSINNDDPSIDYTGNWLHSVNRTFGDYEDDVHFTKTNEDYVEYTFNGTGIAYITEKNTDMGDVDIYIDDIYQETVSCLATTRRSQQVLYETRNLVNGTHTFKAVKKSGNYMLVDAFTTYEEVPVATFYQHTNFKGTSVELEPGEYTLSQMKSKGLTNDDISSIQVPEGYRVIGYQHGDFTGSSWSFDEDAPDLIDMGCNDEISSIRIILKENN